MSAASACWNISHSKCSWYKLANSIDKWDGGISKKDLFIQLSKSVPGQSTQSRMKPLQLHFSPRQDCTILLTRRATVWRKGRGAQVKQHFGEVLKKEQDFAVSGWVRDAFPCREDAGTRHQSSHSSAASCPAHPAFLGIEQGRETRALQAAKSPALFTGSPAGQSHVSRAWEGQGRATQGHARDSFPRSERCSLL